MKKEIWLYPPALSPLAPSPALRALLVGTPGGLFYCTCAAGRRASVRGRSFGAVPGGVRRGVRCTAPGTAPAPTCRGAWPPYLKEAGNVLFFSRKTCIKSVSLFFSDLQAMFHRNSKIVMLPMNTHLDQQFNT